MTVAGERPLLSRSRIREATCSGVIALSFIAPKRGIRTRSSVAR
jgi:hypothetical protein